ncbi:MAG: LPS export ABC transporter periplasmic protein LptC [Omnitrophica bacterium RIFCSPLOWO2_12_FULL_44_17]|uniref:LPS export ABC transporter periplasmic protein LptC n=1 Tax=Candidatus Danuiimicrobium aquiferis TaxID=1801832 RepID=A0A1G1L1Z4_9BACT|nr:MAG: LPS export ABC transporter periplasmic protein LptC [Omnitrophica bacterium RIFCSPHIGHO2_02_FULL_45_28]OGW91287.1 MAG: LPS export ABC transporter periplasmic protein LptC [Omnitrophica bacterium RIFCSPHIGHO2_12_FULL_44_12]OGW99182.1 MAG: LPS export ABC transporter periplasmic protein LptC [Omnitrophica bacterium RIFCSPLOWO2_12_FULL_44_17]OGX04402.1 MAG: LPS export ABC transporter periplasmic protein LptC [Omnitrophica bacterium RIFCSPLOWO2_02_FULL_44_11]
MVKKFLMVAVLLVVAYIALVQFKLLYRIVTGNKGGEPISETLQNDVAQKVYSFSFSKYNSSGSKELEIEGDSADILAQNVKLINVIAKAYAEDSPVTITADKGDFNRSTSQVKLKENVVATTETGTRLMTNELDIFPSDKRLETQEVANVKKDNISIKGTGAESDSQMERVHFKKNVTVMIQNPDSETKKPTIITSDGPLEIDYKRNVAFFKKNVQAVDDRGTLKSDFMDVYYDKELKQVSKMVARGNVIIESKEGNKTYSDSAVYLAKEGRVVLGGDVETEYVAEEKYSEKDKANIL